MDYEDFFSDYDVDINNEEIEILEHFKTVFSERILYEVEEEAKKAYGKRLKEIDSFKEDKANFEKEYRDKSSELRKKEWDLKDKEITYKKITSDYKEKFKNLNEEFSKKVENLAKERFVDFVFKNIPKSCYTIYLDRKEKPKCDKCNEYRNIVAVDKFGKEHFVSCECSGYVVEYLVEEQKLGLFKQQVSYGGDGYSYSYNIGFGWGTVEVANVDDAFVDNLTFDQLDKMHDKGISTRNMYFKSEERAKEYAKHLQKKEE